MEIVRDQISVGADSPPRSPLRSTVLGVLILAGGMVVGLHGRAQPSPDPAPSPVELTAGAIEPNVDGPGWAEFVLPLHNGGKKPVRVMSAVPVGWAAHSQMVTIRPDRWARVPLNVLTYCRKSPGTNREILVRTEAWGDVRVELPGPAYPFLAERARRCDDDAGKAPTRKELLGTWRADDSWTFAGRMRIRFHRDGHYQMRSTQDMFSWSPARTGTFTLRKGELILRAWGGGDCQRGDRAVWRATVLADGSLQMHWLEQYNSWCLAPDDAVWVSRRTNPPYPATLTLR